jgi:hypothetical protein
MTSTFFFKFSMKAVVRRCVHCDRLLPSNLHTISTPEEAVGTAVSFEGGGGENEPDRDDTNTNCFQSTECNRQVLFNAQ